MPWGSLEEMQEAIEHRWMHAETDAKRALKIAEKLLPNASSEAIATLTSAILHQINTDALGNELQDISTAIEHS